MKLRLLALVVCIPSMAASAVAQETRSELFAQQPGRYQIVTSPHNVRDTFLLDTGSGRVWRLIRYTDMEEEPTAWNEMPRFDHDKGVIATMIKYGLKFKTTPEPAKPVDPKTAPRVGPPVRLGPQSGN